MANEHLLLLKPAQITDASFGSGLAFLAVNLGVKLNDLVSKSQRALQNSLTTLLTKRQALKS